MIAHHANWMMQWSLPDGVCAGVQVWKFIVDREIEAPERFRAIQTYRATMAVLRQQVSFLDQLFDSGVIDEMEKELLEK